MKTLLATLLLLTTTVYADDEEYLHGFVKLAFPDGTVSLNYEVAGPLKPKTCQLTASSYEAKMKRRVDGSRISVLSVSATCSKRSWFAALSPPKRV